jgi:hypothetical protein
LTTNSRFSYICPVKVALPKTQAVKGTINHGGNSHLKG